MHVNSQRHKSNQSRCFWKKRFLPLSKKEAQKVRYMATSNTIIIGKLYRRSATEPLLRFLDREEQKLALESVHEGICVNTYLVGDWPLKSEGRKCRQCQLYSIVPKQPPWEMTSVVSPIPFTIWEGDIVGILPTSTN